MTLLQESQPAPSFNRINSVRSIPTSRLHFIYVNHFLSFNRINSVRSIPTFKIPLAAKSEELVSIVSIQADQSRHLMEMICNHVKTKVSIVSIQADQSRLNIFWFDISVINRFQSYQFRQINPDALRDGKSIKCTWTVSIVSIQADQSRRVLLSRHEHYRLEFQSYQFRQINPD